MLRCHRAQPQADLAGGRPDSGFRRQWWHGLATTFGFLRNLFPGSKSTAPIPVPLPGILSAYQDHQHRLETLAWLSKTPIVPVDDLTVRRHDCVTKGQHSGWLRDVADLTHEAIAESGSLSGLIATLGRGIPRLPMIFQGPEDISRAFVGTDQRVGLSKRILPRDELAKLFYWGITVGVVPVERVRLPVRARDPWGEPRATRTIRVWEPRQLRFEWATNRWLLETQLGPIDIKDALDEEGRPVFVLWTPYDSSRPWRLAPWRWLSLMAILSRDSVYARARHLQVLSPKRVVSYTEFWTDKQRALMQTILEASTYNGWLMLPPEATYQIANVSGNDITTVYQSVIDWARGEAEIGLFGQKVTTEGNKGFSEGDIFRDTAESHIDFYATSAADFLSESIVDPWVDDCWGEAVGDVGFRWDAESPDRKRQRAEALGKLGTSFKQLKDGADAVGLDVDPSDAIRFGREHGIRFTSKEGNVQVAKLDLAPTDVAKAVTVDEVRVSQGLKPIGGERGGMFVAEVGQPAVAPQAAPEVPNAA